MQASNALSDRENALGFIVNWWRNLKSQRAAIDELNYCGKDEAAHIARDVGVGPAELRILAGKWPDAADLLSRRLAAAGLQEEQIGVAEPQALRDLERVCTQCEQQNRCERDFDRYENGRSWRDYCPNVATLDALRREQRDRRLRRRSAKWRSF